MLLPNKEPIKIARAILQEEFRDPEGQKLYSFGHYVYEHDGTQWVHHDENWLFTRVMGVLEDSTYNAPSNNGHIEMRFAPKVKDITDITALLKRLVEFPEGTDIPCWLREGAPHHPGMMIPFQNVIVDVAASAKAGKYVTYPKDRTLFSRYVMPFDWDENAATPTWDRCMMEWSGGDTEWIALRERAYGYALLGRRHHAKWLMEYGKIRSGKGTGPRMLRAFMGSPAFIGIAMEDLVQDFGQDVMEVAQALVIGEAEELTQRQSRRFATLLKLMLGGDRMTVRVKYHAQKRDVMSGAFPIIQSNEPLSLPNDQRGLSGKLLALSFDRSFAGQEDVDLIDKLMKEQPGVARRFVDGAIALEVEKRWPMPETSKLLIEEFELESNLFDAFLKARFVPQTSGFVPHELIRTARQNWEVRTKHVLRTKQGVRVSDPRLPETMARHASWSLTVVRRMQAGAMVKGLAGLVMLRDPDDGIT